MASPEPHHGFGRPTTHVSVNPNANGKAVEESAEDTLAVSPGPEATDVRANRPPAPAHRSPEKKSGEPLYKPVQQELRPRYGWPRVQYRFNMLTGRPDKLPAYNAKEVAERRKEYDDLLEAFQAALFQYRQEWLIERLRFLANLGIQPIMSFCNIKSASKTTVALYVGSIIAEFTRRTVLIMPATANTATSTLALMAGIDEGNFITVSEYSRDIKQFGAYRALSQRVPRTRFGLSVLSEDVNNATDVRDEYAVRQFSEIIDVTLPNVDVLILDQGNDGILIDSIALEATRRSHVLNFPYLTDTPITRKSLGRTIGGYATDTTAVPELDASDQTGRRIPTLMKVKHSIIIASKAPLDKEIDFKALTQQGTKNPVEWEGAGKKVPADSYIGQPNDDDVIVCDIDEIDPVTLQAYLDIAVTNFETAAFLQGIDLVLYEADKPSLRYNPPTFDPPAWLVPASEDAHTATTS